ncbi:SMODS domain-containing nucleotidyltransferase [Burkholderia cenocepacia]|uniref:SMODS domain-containing nucleotidyltransferase n=1 Tax=Burkholderia cenocepacia TaxID=95486 RepID=UPI0009818B8F|nr:nucleotidyltransferase [Burkholderia cenocepacia]AQQ26677.1 nucleotidyltransferase [Burkholderia cenocepacia]ONV95422.1 nucleotidyltransferase [Burkholderia cenocepacia]ONW15533.1 nucleotidyltransferase [Burkholderia cenocepacia]ONW26291.1 nucleotidyltransferase [Burkholderia cenocepacia]ONW43276.1 nucleotidyltransferase [Burkholderia cenocepacia]
MSVLSFLNDTASKAVLSPRELSSISTSISTLKSRLATHFEGEVIKKHFCFGSSTRGTILPRSMDGKSDIDYMVVFGDGGFLPQTYLNRLKIFVEENYRTSEIFQSSPTIVLELNHIKFDLVPATLSWLGGLRIPHGPGHWQSTYPNDFNRTLETRNKDHCSLIKPTIRLFKYWNATSGYPFPSFSMEKWVCQQGFWWRTGLKDYFFSVIDSLSTSSSQPKWVNDEIKRAKKIVANTKYYELGTMGQEAETEIRRLFRL